MNEVTEFIGFVKENKHLRDSFPDNVEGLIAKAACDVSELPSVHTASYAMWNSDNKLYKLSLTVMFNLFKNIINELKKKNLRNGV